jgi:hypothetical protein
MASNVFSSVASAAYWVGVLGLLEAATSFDYSTGAEPNEALITAKLAGVLLLAPLVYALLLRTMVPVRSIRRWLGLVAFAALAGLYWLASTFVYYGLTAGDRRDGPVEPSWTDRVGVLLFVLAAIAIFALLLRGFRTMMSGRTEGASHDA